METKTAQELLTLTCLYLNTDVIQMVLPIKTDNIFKHNILSALRAYTSMFYKSVNNSILKRLRDCSDLYLPAGNRGGLFKPRPILLSSENKKWQ
jgi:hypothetical protein